MDEDRDLQRDPEIPDGTNEEADAFEGESFQDRITGENELGGPACRLILRLGGEDDIAMRYDAGPVYFTGRDFGDIYLVDLTFPPYAVQQFRHTLEIFEQFVDSIDKTTGEYDPNRMLIAMFLENSEYHTGGLIAQMPVFFAQTAKEFMAPCDTLRIAFIRNCLAELQYDEGEVQVDSEEDL